MLRLVRVAAGHRRFSLTAATALGRRRWVLCLRHRLGVDGTPVASTSAAALTVDEVQQVRADLADQPGVRRRDRAGRRTPARRQRPSCWLGLRGKDVLVVFVESYGRVAVQDTSFSAGVDAVLDRGHRGAGRGRLSTRSAFLTSPTFGAGSWLAHSTLQSGLWVDSQRRYRQLLGADRLTLTSLFGRAGWRTVFDVPAEHQGLAGGRGRSTGSTSYYDSRNVGYQGPEFGYAPMPDQYTLAEFHRRELAPTRPASR